MEGFDEDEEICGVETLEEDDSTPFADDEALKKLEVGTVELSNVELDSLVTEYVGII